MGLVGVQVPLRAQSNPSLSNDSLRRPVAPHSSAVGSLVCHTAPRLTAPESGRFADRLTRHGPATREGQRGQGCCGAQITSRLTFPPQRELDDPEGSPR
jgi:hypothetical protein